MKIKKIIFILGTAILSIHSINVMAEDLAYTRSGVINDVRINEGVIVIDDMLYRIAPYAKINRNNKYPEVFTAQDLGPNMIVGMNPGGIIDELWLLDNKIVIKNRTQVIER